MVKKEKSNKQLKLQELYEKGADLIEVALESMNKSIVALCEKNIDEMRKYAQNTIQSEKKSDKVHDQIINKENPDIP